MHFHALLGAIRLLGVAALAGAAVTGKPDENGKYWIYGEGISAAFVPYGASISDLLINDRYGIPRDIVLGFDNATYYTIDEQHPHLGSVPGRYANRIKNSTFEIDGEVYHILPNENPTEDHPDGLNTLHGGPDGWDWRNFTVVAHTENSITFSIVDPDGKEGFPGEVIAYITYTLGNMTWDAKMVAIATTKKTPIMLSSHTYWNLDGFANNETNTVLNHTLHLPYSGQRVAVDNILIPTGEIVANAKGSVNDFWSAPKQLGHSFSDPEIHGNCGFNCTGYGTHPSPPNPLPFISALSAPFSAQVCHTPCEKWETNTAKQNTDNCWLINRPEPYDWRAPGGFVASLSSAWSGIRLDVYTDQEAFQVYSCNGQDGTMALKASQGLSGDHAPFPRTVPQYGCVVLEVQDWIDAVNHPEWGRQSKQLFAPGGDPYVLQVSHRFSVS